MTKETNAEDDFLGDLGNAVEQDPFTPIENDDLFPEEEIQKEEVIPNKPVPFAKDEKIQRYIDRQVEKRMKTQQPTATETFRQELTTSDPDLVKAFETIIGSDTEEKKAALKALETSLSRVDERATQKAIERIQEVQQEAVEREERELAEAHDQIEEGFEDIENHYGIELNEKQKSAYKEFLLKIEPKGGYQEYPDFIETFEVFRNNVKANRPSNAQAKALASRGMERSSPNNESSSAPKRDGTKPLWASVEKMLGQ